MNVHFSLRQQGNTDPIIILQIFDGRFKARKFMYSTGFSIAPSNWKVDTAQKKKNKKTTIGRPKALASNIELNDHLDDLERRAREWLRARFNSKSLSREDLRKHFEASKKDERKEQEQQFQKENDFFKIWQEIIDTTKNQKTGKKITDGTKRNKEQTKNLVSAYCIDRKKTLTFETIDMNFYRDLDEYIDGLGSINFNSKGRIFKDIKAICREADDRDYPVNPAFRKKSFKVIREEVESTYLDYDGIQKFLSPRGELTNAQKDLRDIFIMACFVGARHSDWKQIVAENIIMQKGEELLKIKQKKTKEIAYILVHPVVRTLLNKLKGKKLKVISNQKFNDALKEIAKAALQDADGKPDMVKINDKWVEKWSTISTHTARRSFATNAYLDKMDVYEIMNSTGHKTEASFLKYLKLKGSDLAMRAADSKFYKDDAWTMQLAS